jgi:hypothetical protein
VIIGTESVCRDYLKSFSLAPKAKIPGRFGFPEENYTLMIERGQHRFDLISLFSTKSCACGN